MKLVVVGVGQCGCRIAAPSSQSCSHRNSLLDIDIHATRIIRSFQHGPRRWVNEVPSVCGESRMIGCNENALLLCQKEPERIMEGDLLKDGLNLVISVFPFPEDTQHQINFRRRF